MRGSLSALAAVLFAASRVHAQEALLLEVDPQQEAYELADLAKHRLTAHVGVGYPELPRLGVDYLLTAGASVSGTVGAFVLLPTASLQLNLFLVENLGFRPFLAPGALATLRAETGDLALGPALRVGFENRGVGGDWFRAEIGAAYTLGPGPGPWVPILAVARGFSPFP